MINYNNKKTKRYFQDYMDKKDLNESVMKDYLKELSPFEGRPEPAKYPLADLKPVRPRWYKYELINKRKRRCQYSIIPFKHPAPSPKEKLDRFIQSLPYQQKD